MTDVENSTPTIPQPEFKDRKTRLVVFGILQIILGCFGLLGAVFMVFAVIISACGVSGGCSGGGCGAGANIKMIIPGVLIYLLFAGWFITMGIGSIRTKRWARAIILITS